MIFQRLPKKMRRRVMSTTVKRMPKDLRAAHKKSVLKNLIHIYIDIYIYIIFIDILFRLKSKSINM